MTVTPAHADLRLAGIFSDHMVLQRDRPVQIWGRSNRGEEVTVEFAGASSSTTSDTHGAWSVTLPPLSADSDGQELRVLSAEQSVSVQDVVVGEVWHASGQSNMAMTVGAVSKQLESAMTDIATANVPTIRFCRISDGESSDPLDDLRTQVSWTPCSPVTVARFSAAAFYFARQLVVQLDIPVGVIDSSRGGTPIEPFIPRNAFGAHPTLRRELQLGDAGDLDGLWRLPGGVRARDANWLPGRLFHSRLAPVTRFAVRGAIWYQGESNCGDREDPRDYQHKMRALITGWRGALGNEQMPFYFVQLPGSGAREGWPYLREQQRLATGLPHTGMIVTVDLQGAGIHPPNKIDVGRRLALWALANDYGKHVAFSGPLFERQEIREEKIIVHFKHADSGLMVASKDGLSAPCESPGVEPGPFEIMDETGKWWPANAVIDGSTLVVGSEEIQSPIAVRYAYEVTPQTCNLYNRDGLPASPFCSRPELLKYDPLLPNSAD